MKMLTIMDGPLNYIAKYNFAVLCNVIFTVWCTYTKLYYINFRPIWCSALTQLSSWRSRSSLFKMLQLKVRVLPSIAKENKNQRYMKDFPSRGRFKIGGEFENIKSSRNYQIFLRDKCKIVFQAAQLIHTYMYMYIVNEIISITGRAVERCILITIIGWNN